MELDDTKVAGTLLFLGAVQFLIVLVVAEALYPNYSVSLNYISDLGVGSTALIFNSSVFLLGLLVVAGAYFIREAFKSNFLFIALILTGIGAMMVGLFPETAGVMHTIASLITFLFGGLAAIVSYKVENPPFSYLSVVLGALGLVGLGLFASGNYLSLGVGGMERMIAHPVLLWAVGFGGHLVSHSKDAKSTAKA
ncbi:DUF998 domain-containing protein [Candidatus Bathyarchaeota archaeon]|jgi:hypothetical membrane protein|nr:DUF998 domain-containing protein [Candidatus Bathyarchaeota archaeon]